MPKRMMKTRTLDITYFSLTDVIKRCTELDLDFDKVEFTYDRGYDDEISIELEYQTLETDEEFEERERIHNLNIQRRKEQYEKLKAEFENKDR
jgi:hypothetical protein